MRKNLLEKLALAAVITSLIHFSFQTSLFSSAPEASMIYSKRY